MSRNGLIIVDIHIAQVQKAITRALKLGMYVYVVAKKDKLDKYYDLVKDADEVFELDFEKYDDLIEIVKKVEEKNDNLFIISFNENALENVARATTELGLFGNSYEVVRRCRDKYETKKCLSQCGISVADYSLCKCEDDIRKFSKLNGYPLIIKPRNLKGSKGVAKIESEKQVENVYKQVVKINGGEKIVLAEDLMRGKEVSIEAIVYKSKVHIWGITEKLLFEDSFVEAGHITPYKSEFLTEKYAYKIVTDIVKALGIVTGPLHIEGYLEKEKLVIGEVHVRYGGDNISTITQLSANCDLHTPIFANMLGLKYSIPKRRVHKYFGIKFLNSEDMLEVEKERLSILKKEGAVVSYEIQDNINSTGKLLSSYDRKGWYIAKGANRDDVVRLLYRA